MSPQVLCTLLVLLAACGALPSTSVAARTMPFIGDAVNPEISTQPARVQYRHPSTLARYSRLQRRQDQDEVILAMFNYHLVRELDENDNSRVVLAEKDPSKLSLLARSAPSVVVAKFMSLPNAEYEQYFKNEVRMLRTVQQWPLSKSVKLYGGYIAKNHRGVILMEFVKGGDLLKWVVKSDGLSESATKYIARQIAGILYDLHAHDVAHRDVKLANFGLDAEPVADILDEFDPVKRQVQVRLFDLGFACYRKDQYAIKNNCGTDGYMAPELCAELPNPASLVTDAAPVDVYAFGCLIMYMLPRKIYRDNVDKNITGCQIIDPSLVSSDLYALLEGMLRKNPRKRFTMKKVIESPWFKDPIHVATDVQVANRQAESMPARHKDSPAKTTTERVKSVAENAPKIDRSKATQPQSLQREVPKPALQLTKSTSPPPAKQRVQEKPHHGTPFANTLPAPGGATTMEFMSKTHPIFLWMTLLSGGRGA